MKPQWPELEWGQSCYPMLKGEKSCCSFDNSLMFQLGQPQNTAPTLSFYLFQQWVSEHQFTQNTICPLLATVIIFIQPQTETHLCSIQSPSDLTEILTDFF